MEENMKRIIGALIAAVALLFTVGCASTTGTTGGTTAAKSTAAKNANPFGFDDATYAKMISESVYSEGNNYRVKKVIEKLRAGDDVYIATLGGSITEGVGPAAYRYGYAYVFRDKIIKTYTPDNGAHVHFVGAGVSGTPSAFGLIRYQKDVVQPLGHTPDLLVLEFAVNDGGDSYFARSYETLVRDALAANDDTAIMLMFSASDWTQQSAECGVGDWYNLPMASAKDAITPQISAGKLTKKMYFADYVHPTKDGHELMADCLMNLLSIADKAELKAKEPVPADTADSPLFSGLAMISASSTDVVFDKGDFSGTDKNMQAYMNSGKYVLPENFYHAPGAGSKSFKMTLTCRTLFFVYKTNGKWDNVKFGSADVYVDGKLVGAYNGAVEGGWNNPVTVLLIDDETAAAHTVEVKMSAGDESKAFTIGAFGYAK